MSQGGLTLSGCTDGSQKVLCTLELESNATVYWYRYIDLQRLIDITFPGHCGQYWAPGIKDLFKQHLLDVARESQVFRLGL